MPRKLVLFQVLWPVPFYRGRPRKLSIHWLPWHILEPFLKEKSFSSLPLRNKPHPLSDPCRVLVYLWLPSSLPSAVYATAFRTMFPKLCVDDDESRRVCVLTCAGKSERVCPVKIRRGYFETFRASDLHHTMSCVYTLVWVENRNPFVYSLWSAQGKITTGLFA